MRQESGLSASKSIFTGNTDRSCGHSAPSQRYSAIYHLRLLVCVQERDLSYRTYPKEASGEILVHLGELWIGPVNSINLKILQRVFKQKMGSSGAGKGMKLSVLRSPPAHMECRSLFFSLILVHKTQGPLKEKEGSSL